MSKIAIVTDSTAYIPSELVKQYNLTVTPQVLIWGEETYQDGVDIQPDEFYERDAHDLTSLNSHHEVHVRKSDRKGKRCIGNFPFRQTFRYASICHSG